MPHIHKKIILPHMLVQSVIDRRVVVVLGAGASMECKNARGRKPPDSIKLRDALAKKFLGTEKEARDLMTVAEMAISNGAGEPLVFEEIAKLLGDFPPSEAHLKICEFSWRGLVTTNYDTLIEEAYRLNSARKQTCLPFVKDAEPYDDRLQAEAYPVPLLKLHGCINHRLDRDIPLVLSHEHYNRFRKNREKLLQRLQHWAESSVLVFIGYKLADSHIRDLIYDIDPGRRPQWYIVTPDADEHDKKYWLRKNVDLIKSTFGDLIFSLDDEIKPLFRSLPNAKVSENEPYTRHFRKFEAGSDYLKSTIGSDIFYVHSGIPFDELSPSKFYSGYDQGWCGIIRKFDFPRKEGEKLLYSALDESQNSVVRFYLLTGAAGAGKTIALKRAAFDAATALDELVFWLSEAGAVRPEFFQELYELTGKRTILFVDQISLHSDMILQTLESASLRDIPLTIIAAEREADWGSYCSKLEEKYPPEMFSLRALSEREAEDLVELLDRHKSLGLLAEKTKKEQIEEFLRDDRSDRQLLVALHELTQGKPFEDIVLDEYMKVLPETARRLYLDIATIHQFGVIARAGAISRISGIRFEDFENEFFRPLQNIVKITHHKYTGDKGYITRHSHVARIVFGVACKTDEEISSQIVRIITGLDSGFTSDARVIEEICKGRIIASQFSDISHAREVFDIACEVSPGSAFLFQQAAIMEYQHKNGSFERAENLANKARSLDDNNHIYIHTLAEISRRKANESELKVQKDKLRSQARAYLNEIWLKDSRKDLSFCNLLVDEAIDLSNSITDQVKDYEVIEFDTKVDEAVARLNKAFQDFPDETEFLTLESRLWQHLGENEKAIGALNKAIRARPRNSGAYSRLARIYQKKKEYEESERVLKEGLTAFADDKSLHLQMALYLLKEASIPNQTIEYHLKSSFASGDHNFDGRYFYAAYLFWAGRVEESAQLFSEIDQRAGMSFRKAVPRFEDTIARKLGDYRGVVESKKERFFFIRSGVYPSAIFAHSSTIVDLDYASLTTGDAVEFRIKFNRKGPVAVGVRHAGHAI